MFSQEFDVRMKAIVTFDPDEGKAKVEIEITEDPIWRAPSYSVNELSPRYRGLSGGISAELEGRYPEAREFI